MWDLPIPGSRGTQVPRGGPDVASHTIFTPSKSLAETILTRLGVDDLRTEEGKVSGLKLFRTSTINGGVTEVMPRLAEVEADVQDLVEAHMETMLGVTFLASEYVIGCADGGRIDSLGLDENGAPVIVEFTDRR